jgi:hypothetical protein
MKTLLLIAACAIAAFAADVTGEWKATAEGPNGSMERTLSLKAEGSKLTGQTVSSFTGKSAIEDGKVDGDTISFVITASFQGNEMKIQYKGKVTGADSMELTSQIAGGDGQGFEWKAKRVK